MSDNIKDLINRLSIAEDENRVEGMSQNADEFAEAFRAIEQQAARIAELEAARTAYASEFPLNADGEPDVGNVHANIRAMKKDAERYRWLRGRYIGFDFGWSADENGDNGKQVLCFEMDNGMRISADIDASIDAQTAASEPKKEPT